MTSQEQIQDEILAKRLQELEYQDHRRSTDSQARNDAAFARQLSGQEIQPQPETRFALQTGQTAMIRLHHPLTARQIGEVMYVHYVGTNTMCFELATSRGKYLRATSSGTVEFTTNNDDKTKFLIEPVSTLGTMYLRNKNYANKTNASGVSGWYLSMSAHGVLSSNGAKNEYAQWALISATNGATAGPPIPPQPQQQRYTPQLPPVQHQPVPTPAAAPAPHHHNASIGSGQQDGVELQSLVMSDSDAENPMLRDLRLASEAVSDIPAGGGSGVVMGSVVASSAPAQHQHQQSHTQSYHQQQPQLAQQQYSGLQRSTSYSSAAAATLLFAGHDAGREALGRFFQTATGVQFLSQPAYQDALRLHYAGTLGKILHRSDWPVAASRFADYAKLPHPALNASLADHAASFSDKKGFFESGFLLLRGAVSSEQILRALRISNHWMSKHVATDSKTQSENIRRVDRNRLELTGALQTDCDLLALYYDSPVCHVVQQLLGEGDVACPTLVKVVSTGPSLDLPPEYPLTGSAVHPEKLGGDRWVIEGFEGGGHSPFNVLVAVALTDMVLPNQGNLCVHPGSQMVLMEAFKQQAELRSALYSEDPLMHQKPDLGEPQQLLLRAGDAVLVTQRLACLFAPNTSSAVQTMAFIRVSHVDHEVLKGPALDGIWIEFRGSDKYQGEEEAVASPVIATSNNTTNSSSSCTGGGGGGGGGGGDNYGDSGAASSDLLISEGKNATSISGSSSSTTTSQPVSVEATVTTGPALSLFDEMMSLSVSTPGVVTADPLLPSQLSPEGEGMHPMAEASSVAEEVPTATHFHHSASLDHNEMQVATAVPTTDDDVY